VFFKILLSQFCLSQADIVLLLVLFDFGIFSESRYYSNLPFTINNPNVWKKTGFGK